MFLVGLEVYSVELVVPDGLPTISIEATVKLLKNVKKKETKSSPNIDITRLENHIRIRKHKQHPSSSSDHPEKLERTENCNLKTLDKTKLLKL
ncbi:hypothetical protein TNIN_188481 [Trichonephila inaurata madagascariensis]|uniref:Uncharacterized protein n=1 Tax=Trichonephila inaurata madagascariensis TaxID=2747483 RepID=A0A8X6Y516_9ARAC|nr:hypothetical protein TNIN_188481 [Trichonephila inaurata madagascariensis]